MGYSETKQAPPSESQKPDTAVVTVSIVVPMYCCEEYVPELMEDLLSQEFEDMEILCIIDGSPDETLQRVETYARTDNRIRVFYQEHGGAGTARNYGLSLARGKYIMFLDADDRYSPIFVSRMVQAIEESEADIATCYFQSHNSWTGTTNKTGFSPSLLLIGKVLHPSQVPDLFCSFSTVVHNKIYRRSFILAHNLHFSFTNSINDLFFAKASLVCAAKIRLVPTPLYTYRMHHNAHSISSNRSLYQQDVYKVYEEFFTWLISRGQANHYLNSFFHAWRNSFRHVAQYVINEDFQITGVRFLLEQEPWCDMSYKELYRLAGLDTKAEEFLLSAKNKRLKTLSPGTPSYESMEMRIKLQKNRIENIKAIREHLSVINTDFSSLRASLPQAILWKVSDRYSNWGLALLTSGKSAFNRLFCS